MNKKVIILVAVALAVTAGWFGYRIFTTTTTTTTTLYPGKITIGNAPWPGYLGLYIAADKGYFKERGLDVDVKSYPSFTALSKDYRAGNIQGRANLTLDAVNEAADGLGHRIVVVIDYSNGADGIIASSKIKQFSDIKGKRVAFEYDTLEEYFFRYALDANALGLADIVPINLDPENSAKAVVSGAADAAVTYEPFMGAALLQGGGTKIYSSAVAPGLITDILTFRLDFLGENPETVQVIVEEYFRAIQFWKEHPDEANAIIAKRLGITPEDAAAQLEGLIILDKEENRTAFTFAIGPQSLYGNLRNIGEFIDEQLQKTGGRSVDTDTLIEPTFIRHILR